MVAQLGTCQFTLIYQTMEPMVLMLLVDLERRPFSKLALRQRPCCICESQT